MNLRIARFMLVALVVPTVFYALAPTASAQATGATIQMSLTADTTPIKPLSEVADIPVQVTYTYTSTSPGILEIPVTLTVTGPAWASAIVSPSTIYESISPTQPNEQQADAAQKVDVLVTVTADAPAFTSAPLLIKADAASGGATLPAASSQIQTYITADYFSIIDATATSTIQQATPQSQVAYPITVTNLGNAQTKFFFNVDPKSVPDGWQVVPPTPITLDSRQAGGKNTAQSVNLMIQTPYHNGYLNEVGAIVMTVSSSYALDPKVIGDTTTIATLTTDRGFYVPGFEPVFALAGLGLAAIVIRRRR
ncbi:MAG: PGF-CTERM sorting domain-containing protein [Thermoplasmatota archaeon]